MAESRTESEHVLGQKWDQCVSDTILKVGAGLGLGVIFSVFLFKRKLWPIHLAGGVGLGMGIGNCNSAFQDPYSIRGSITKVLKETQASTSAAETSTAVVTTGDASKS